MAHFTGDAVAEIKKIKALPNGDLDYASMPAFAIAPDGSRNITNIITMLEVAIQQLAYRVEELEKKPK